MFSKQINSKPYVIAEVGQNHQGDLDTALEYIRVFALQGADAIKFQTRNNKYLFSLDAYEKPYNSGNVLQKNMVSIENYWLDIESLPILKEECKK